MEKRVVGWKRNTDSEDYEETIIAISLTDDHTIMDLEAIQENGDGPAIQIRIRDILDYIAYLVAKPEYPGKT